MTLELPDDLELDTLDDFDVTIEQEKEEDEEGVFFGAYGFPVNDN